jgi:isoaspartyl peptidase/L-asparaginase-like protein (Ntn-hydrolase superfamily)
MDGKTLDCGSVAAVENIRHVAALARKVYEKTPHVMLVGKGAEWFAIQNGFPLETLLTPESVAEWEKNRPKRKVEPKGHDTVTVLANDGNGRLGGVCTTSGLSYKLPGRVGDSPLIGAGCYADDATCAVSATGDGELIIRALLAAEVASLMRLRGLALAEAAKTALRERVGPLRGDAGLIALDLAGNVAMPANTTVMHRGVRRNGGEPETAVFV